MGEIVLVRHGETEWSATGRHTSHTDIDLTPRGVRQAEALGAALAGREFAAVLCSPRLRARRTAELAGLTVTALDTDLVEWEYGRYEGITTAQIRAEVPRWDLWRDGSPGGESPAEIGARTDRVLTRARAITADGDGDGDVALVGHGHCLRVVGARWIGLPPAGGGLLRLDTATVSTLAYEHGRPVLWRWNVAPGLTT